MICRVLAGIALSLGCGYATAQPFAPKCVEESRDGSANRECVGVSLAGGGTKSASVAMGVLTGLAEGGVLDKLDAVSSVSGGTYAAYFYFSKLRELQRNRGQKDFHAVESRADFFRDCIPRAYERVFAPSLLPSLADPGGAAAGFGTKLCRYDYRESRESGYFDPYRFQTHVRCRQDVFEAGECRFQTTAEEDEPLGGGLPTVAGTLLTVVPLTDWLSPLSSLHHFSRTLFDWPVNTSPMREAYRQGLGVTFGLYPNRPNQTEGLNPCKSGEFSNCHSDRSEPAVDEGAFTVADLRTLYQEGASKPAAGPSRVPLWFINSTATPSRSIFGWATQSALNSKRDVFEIHPFGYGSGFYGRNPKQELRAGVERMNILDAVNVSAAFLDSNVQSVPQPGRFGAALGMHVLNLSWGLDIPNYNVGEHRRAIHSLLPFPLYYMDGFFAKLRGPDGHPTFFRDTPVDSAWIRMIDGGQSENLGAYALIRRGYGYVLLADGAQDSGGRMQDLCNLRLQLLEHHGWQLLIPGLDKLDGVCRQSIGQVDSGANVGAGSGACPECFENTGLVRKLYGCEPDDSVDQCLGRDAAAPKGYYVRRWTQPFLVGCVLNNQGDRMLPNPPDSGLCNTPARRSWVVLVKPALRVESVSGQLDVSGTQVARCGGAHELPCEVTAYLLWNPAARLPESTKAVFPQHSTFLMTLDSSYTRYGAYKDLMRSHTAEAIAATLPRGQADNAAMARLLGEQGEDKNRIKPY